jgi:hypothetical protein
MAAKQPNGASRFFYAIRQPLPSQVTGLGPSSRTAMPELPEQASGKLTPRIQPIPGSGRTRKLTTVFQNLPQPIVDLLLPIGWRIGDVDRKRFFQ